MIKFDKVSKKFGKITALEGVSFKVDPGELVFLTGPSGSGKTTLIKLILKEFRPTSGKIQVKDWDLSKLADKKLFTLRRKIGVVFQDFKLLFDRTVWENVALALEILGENNSVGQKVDNALARVGLLDRAELFPSQLAGGELQRTCLARALVADPEIIIADEPTGNLDITTAWQIIALLKEAHGLGKTVLISTHNFEVVNSFKNRVIGLDQGKLVSDEKKGRYKIK
jgi:cell division transport system ATP-binding protein